VSPPGADFSEPVTQNTLRIVDAFYALDVALANRRHFPAINWLTSYSLYVEDVEGWWAKIGPEWAKTRATALGVLQEESRLEEIVRLVGPESLPESDKLILMVARMIREDFLAQNAYSEIDTYSNPFRAHLMLRTIMKFNDLTREMLAGGTTVAEIRQSPIIFRISRMKDIPEDVFEQRIKELWSEMDGALVVRKGGV
jgi:V/A-type H+-transporting ATPase subunit A